MKKSIVLISLALSIVSVVLYRTPSISGKIINVMSAPASRESAWEYLDSQPIPLRMPTELPTSIHDPLLMAGWIYLYNQERTFQLWDGSSLSGRMLAEFVFENNITILWGTPDICHGISCSPKPVCTKEPCTGENLEFSPIYITASLKNVPEGEIIRLVELIAHEIFHHTQPFGFVYDTLFEEYWAFYVGMQVVQNVWGDFDRYNSRNNACLKLWFMEHGLTVYFGIDPYPQSMISSVNLDAVNCLDVTDGMISVYQITSNGP